MKYNTTLSQAFGLVFFMIVVSGIISSVSPLIAAIGLAAAFTVNVGLFVVCFAKATKDGYFYFGTNTKDYDVHP